MTTSTLPTNDSATEARLALALAKIDELTPEPGSAVTRAKLRGLMRGYARRWDDSGMEIVEVEELAASELYNPATEARSRSFVMAGKKDILFREDGYFWLMDHKTSSDDIGSPDCAFWSQLTVEAQHLHYALLELARGVRIEGAVWDVVRKPMIAPRLLTKAETTLALASSCWCGAPLTAVDLTAIRETGRETPAMYEARLANDCGEIRPGWYFGRKRIARRDDQLLEYATELWGHTQDLLAARRNNAWPRNSGACLLYGSPCQFLGICSGFDEPTSRKWRQRDWVHPELPVFDTRGRDILTNSRVRCFQTCRKKHFLTYEMGIERVDDDERAALYFGRIWHEALQVWFEQLRESQQQQQKEVSA